MAGLKILYNNYVIFIDSLNFLPFLLIKFPSTFGLMKYISKCWYLHYFNTSANYNYVGPNCRKFYGMAQMCEKERSELKKIMFLTTVNN